jgi:hypothetical protein
MTQIVDRLLAQRRLTTLLMAGFSALALLLAAVCVLAPSRRSRRERKRRQISTPPHL